MKAGRARSHEFAIDESLGYLVNRVARSMANQLAERMRPAGIGIGQWAVLLFLLARDGLSQAELSGMLRSSRQRWFGRSIDWSAMAS